jgi:hypothetical protein
LVDTVKGSVLIPSQTWNVYLACFLFFYLQGPMLSKFMDFLYIKTTHINMYIYIYLRIILYFEFFIHKTIRSDKSVKKSVFDNIRHWLDFLITWSRRLNYTVPKTINYSSLDFYKIAKYLVN